MKRKFYTSHSVCNFILPFHAIPVNSHVWFSLCSLQVRILSYTIEARQTNKRPYVRSSSAPAEPGFGYAAGEPDRSGYWQRPRPAGRGPFAAGGGGAGHRLRHQRPFPGKSPRPLQPVRPRRPHGLPGGGWLRGIATRRGGRPGDGGHGGPGHGPHPARGGDGCRHCPAHPVAAPGKPAGAQGVFIRKWLLRTG